MTGNTSRDRWARPVSRRRAGRSGGPRRADGPVRRRADGDRRLSDLARRRASGDPVAEVTIVAVAVLRRRPAAAALPRAARLSRPRAPRARTGARSLLRADRAARPGAARGLPPGRPAVADGRRRRRAPEPVPARPRAAARRAPRGRRLGRRRRRLAPRRGARARRRTASWRRCRCRGWRGCSARRAGRRQAAARGELSAELIELLRAAPELVAFGAEQAALDRVRAPTGRWSSWPAATRSPPASRDGLELVVTGVTVAGVLAVAVEARPGRATLDRVLIAMLALLALASFEAVTPLAGAARELSATLAAGRRVLELTGREAARPRPERTRAGRRAGRSRSRSRTYAPATPVSRGPRSTGSRLGLEPGERVALRRSERRGQDDGHQPAAALPRSRARAGHARRPRPARVPPGGRPRARSRSPARSRTCSRPASATTSGSPGPSATDAEIAGRAPPRADLGVDRRAPGRPRHVGRRGRARALGRPASADRARARAARRTRRCWCSTSRPPISIRRPRTS